MMSDKYSITDIIGCICCSNIHDKSTKQSSERLTQSIQITLIYNLYVSLHQAIGLTLLSTVRIAPYKNKMVVFLLYGQHHENLKRKYVLFKQHCLPYCKKLFIITNFILSQIIVPKIGAALKITQMKYFFVSYSCLKTSLLDELRYVG